MKILAIDTSCSTATICLADEFNTIGEFTINNKLTHSEHLLPMIDIMFKTLKIDINCIDYIACSIGPGSFTGLRIAVATTKGLAHALDKKVVPVPTLSSLAYNVFDTSKIIVPIINARRNNVYTSFYKWNNMTPIPMFNCIYQNIDTVLSDLKIYNQAAVFCGDGVLMFKDKILNNGFNIAASGMIMPKASSVASLAFKIINTETPIRYSELNAFYLRETQAEREFKEKNK